MSSFLPNLFQIKMDKINSIENLSIKNLTSTLPNSTLQTHCPTSIAGLSSTQFSLKNLHQQDEEDQQQEKTRVGEIFLTKNNLLYFVCTYCNENFPNVTFYVEHLYKHLTNKEEENFQEEPLNLSVLSLVKHKRKTKIIKEDKTDTTPLKEEDNLNEEPPIESSESSINNVAVKIENDDSDDEKYDDIIDTEYEAPPGYFRCKVCKNNYTCNYKRRHRATHFEEKPFKCEFCGRHFARNDCLQLHTRIHVGEKPYKCEFCPKAFLTKGQKTSHEVIHRRSGERNFQCEMCNKKFLRKKGLIEHRERHFHKGDIIKDPSTNMASFVEKEGKSGRLKLYKCFTCEETFSSYNKKKLHERELHGITKARSIEMIKNYFLG